MIPAGIVAACAVSFALGVASLALLGRLFLPRSGSKRKRGGARTNPAPPDSKPKEAAKRKGIIERIGVMNLILVLIGAALLVFTLAMIDLFKTQYAIPDTLVTCVFATLGGECGVMGWIKTTKDKQRDRRWRKEDSEQLPPPATGDSDHARNEL